MPQGLNLGSAKAWRRTTGLRVDWGWQKSMTQIKIWDYLSLIGDDWRFFSPTSFSDATRNITTWRLVRVFVRSNFLSGSSPKHVLFKEKYEKTVEKSSFNPWNECWFFYRWRSPGIVWWMPNVCFISCRRCLRWPFGVVGGLVGGWCLKSDWKSWGFSGGWKVTELVVFWGWR